MASRSRQSSQGATGDSSSQRRDTRELASQYVAGKIFKAKYIGSDEVPDLSGGSRAVSQVIKKLRQDKAKQKTGKTKSTITLKFKALTVVDDKSKAAILNVPIQKVKFVCHDHNDVTVFAVIAQRELPGGSLCNYLYCFQAEQKVAVLFVRSMNELFKLIQKMMKAKKQQQQREQQEREQQQQQQQATPTEPEEKTERERFTSRPDQGAKEFGIAAPPPSYKAAISKTNSDIFKIPENMETTPTVLAPPPNSASSTRLATTQQATPNALPRPQTAPSLPALQPPPSTSNQNSGSRPRPRRQTSSGTPASPQSPLAPPTASIQTRPLPQPPNTQSIPNTQSQLASALSTANQDRPLPPPPRTQASSQPQITRLTSNQNRPLPPPPLPPRDTPTSSSTGQQNVWQEWRSLEGELQSIAQEVGIDAEDTGAMESNDRPVSFSFEDDPFNDEFFQTSFSASDTNRQDDFLASVPDPFSNINPPVFGEAPSNTPDISPPDTAADPFAAISTRSPEPVSSDPFANTDTPTSVTTSTAAAVSNDPFANTNTPTSVTTSTTAAESGNNFGFDFASFSPEVPQDPANSFAFDSDFTIPEPLTQSVATDLVPPATTTSIAPATLSSIEANIFEPQNESVVLPPASQPSTQSFEADFFQSVATTSASSAVTSFSFETEFPEPKSTTTVVSTSQPPIMFEADFSVSATSTSVPSAQTQPAALFSFDEPQTSAVPSQNTGNVSFETNFFETQNAQSTATFSAQPQFSEPVLSTAITSAPPTTSAPSKGASLIAAPPSKQRQSHTSPSGGRSRPKANTSTDHPPPPPPRRSSLTPVSQSSNVSDSFNSTSYSTDAESTLQLTNPLYQSQTNSSFQTQPPAANAPLVVAGGGPPQFTSPQNYPPDPNWTISPQQAHFQQGPQPAQPVGAQFPAAYQQQPANAYQFPPQNQMMPQAVPTQNLPMVQVPGQNLPMGQVPGQNPVMGQIPVQNPMMPPGASFQSPMQPAGMYSPPQNMTDYANNPFTGDFSSPPYAIHSSTPQSPPQGPSPAKPPPPKYDGPDVFAKLLPLALSPKKGEGGEDKPPATVASTTTTETPKSTQPKPPKRPSLNELYNQKHSIGMLQPTKVDSTSKLSTSSIGEEGGGDPFNSGKPSAADSNAQQAFDDDFGGDGGSSWVAF